MIHVLRSATCALLVLGATACDRSSAGPGAGKIEAATLKQRDPARVRVEPVVRREMLRVLETTTRVESDHQVEVMSRSAGIVVEIRVEEGDLVAEGQILARLDARDAVMAAGDAEIALEDAKAAEPRLALAIREAEARVVTAKRTFDQASRDYARNDAISQPAPNRPALLSAKDLDASRLARDNAETEKSNAELAVERARLEQVNGEGAVRRAQLALDRARLVLAHMDVTAPFAGVLATRHVKVGDSIGVSTSTFTLTDAEHLRAVFYRPQRELALFVSKGNGSDANPQGPGQGPRSAEVELFAVAEALPGLRFKGTIERIAPTIDPQSGNFRVTARLEAEAEGTKGVRLLPGMLVRLEIITERRPSALVIPKRALRREGDANMVFVVRGDRAVRVAIQEGLSDDESLEVIALGGAALEAGDLVVVVGNRDLEDGSEVKISAEEDLAREPGTAALAEAPPPLAAAPGAGTPAPEAGAAPAGTDAKAGETPAPESKPAEPPAQGTPAGGGN